MMRRRVGAFALTCLLASVVAPLAAGDPVRSLPMQFSFRQEGPATACGDKCRMWISATGMIKPDTVRDFEVFAAKNNIRGATIAFDSEGGSVLGAIALGRAIRRFDMTTTVGKTIDLPASGKEARATLSPRADCESMCAFVLLAGAQRVVPTEARVRVHQIWLGDRRDDATAASYSAEDLVLVQRDIGRLAEYTVEMGGSVALLELSLRIPPWEPMRILSRDELRNMRLDTAEASAEGPLAAPAPTPAALPGRQSQAPAAPIAQPTAIPAAMNSLPATNSAPAATPELPALLQRRALSARGWMMSEQSGPPMLTRQHPITVEGETIGSFDLTFGCGRSPNEFAVLYSENREAEAEPLKKVSLYVGQKTAALIVEPEAEARHTDRPISATGILPATALKALAEPGNRSITVATTNAREAKTSIRIGNSGFGQMLARLASACAQPRTEHAGLVEQK